MRIEDRRTARWSISRGGDVTQEAGSPYVMFKFETYNAAQLDKLIEELGKVRSEMGRWA